MAQVYQYRPLGPSQVRLLRINYVSDSEIDCSLRHIKLDPMKNTGKRKKIFPRWHALSYTWGSMDITRTITVDGQSLPVTENLWLALRRMKLYGMIKLRHLWVDAICINQSDIPERNAQVQRMADIYSTADSTLVWLGEATEDVNIVLRFIRHFCFYLFIKWSSLNKNVHAWMNDLFLVDSLELRTGIEQFFRKWQPVFDKKRMFWPALSSFLRRPWFRRLWVIQEIVLARRIYFHVGKHSLFGPVFAVACKAILLLTTSQPALLSELEARTALQAIAFITHTTICRWMSCSQRFSLYIARYVELPEEKASRFYSQRLEVLIGRTLFSIATDPRDRLFGLLGLVPQRDDYQSLIDYSLRSPAEVYLRLARFCLEELKSPTILSLAGTEIHGREWSTTLPSWVPDLSQKSIHGMPPRSMENEPNLYCMTGRPFNCRILGNILVVEAIIAASVRCIVLPLRNNVNEFQTLNLWFQACDALEAQFQKACLLSKDTFYTACWKTMVWDRTILDGLSSYNTFREFCAAPADDHSTRREKRMQEANTFVAHFRSIGYGTRKAMITTTCGMLVSGPSVSKDGDVISVFAGAEVPFILRPAGGKRYRLVGECFVYGLVYQQVAGFRRDEYNDIELC